uniref:Tf2-1-like SH3-like domain-containing protein n=1 Tax=Nicotiana tabacum TaxID=4097 RepID=A0A1S3Z9J5_TOBAC|nr:PREDICTED: uncharacterized protein LOC107784421 [Nicotiana tabacum]
MKGIMRFGMRGKLILRFIGQFEVLERVGEVTCRLALPSSLSGVHPDPIWYSEHGNRNSGGVAAALREHEEFPANAMEDLAPLHECKGDYVNTNNEEEWKGQESLDFANGAGETANVEGWGPWPP